MNDEDEYDSLAKVEPGDEVQVTWNGYRLGSAEVQRISYEYDGVLLMVRFPREERNAEEG